jgi:hypothetical protein
MEQAMLCIGAALIMGFLISLVYLFAARKQGSSRSFAVAMVLLPVIITVVIMLVGSNIARAFSLAGVFSLVRFRSAPGDAKDITIIFLAMVVGLACGMGFLALGFFLVFLGGVVLVVLYQIGYGQGHTTAKELRITVPEDLNYQDAFSEVLGEYTDRYLLQKVKTTNLGSYFELTYLIHMKNTADEKAFLDALRCRNGNLKIALGLVEEKSGIL